jgi:broad specificity polyphosphatase/5'/3'-nucleotidase SurE
VADFIAHLETKPGKLSDVPGLLPEGVALNINYPPIQPEDVQGVKLSSQGQLLIIGGVPLNIDFVCFACAVIPVGASSPGGIGGAGFDPTPDVKDSDATDFNAGFITIVPIEADYTADSRIRNSFNSVVNEFEF